MTRTYAYMAVEKRDWQVTSMGDLSGFGGLGGGIWHFKFRSPSLRKHMNTLLVAGGVGAGAEVQARWNAILNVIHRARDAERAERGYTRIRCLRAFSMNDMLLGICALASGTATMGPGVAGALLTLRASGQGRARGDLFRRQPIVGDAIGAGLGGSIVWGSLIGIGTEFWHLNTRRRFDRELQRRPSDPVLRDPGMV